MKTAFGGFGHTMIMTVSVEVLYRECFANCVSHPSMTFESNSKVQRIKDCLCVKNILRTIRIPGFVEMPAKSIFDMAGHLHRLLLSIDRSDVRFSIHHRRLNCFG
jgi:hypothetical protein